MANRRLFTNRQWATAFVIAVGLHALLAWSLLTGKPRPQDQSAGQEGGLAVQSLSLNSADIPVLQDTADLAQLALVETPTVQPMTEVAPIEPKRRPIEKPKQKPKPKQQRRRKIPKEHPAHKPAAPNVGRRNRANTGKGNNATIAGTVRSAAPVLSNPRPHYPRIARSRGQEGRVLIRVSVRGDGRVGSAKVAKSSGHGVLDRAALKAVKRWRFKPALRAGKPVAATLTVPVVFRLNG